MQEDKTEEVANATSRRSFLKLSTAAISTAAVGGLELSRSAWAAGSDTIRVGLIGCGGRGTGAAIDALDADPGVKLVAMADLFEDKVEAALTEIRDKHPDRGAVDRERRLAGDRKSVV